MNPIFELIAKGNWHTILHYCSLLSAEDRYTTIEYIKGLDIDTEIMRAEGAHLTGKERTDFYTKRAAINVNLHFALLACTRNYSDVKALAYPDRQQFAHPIYSIFRSTPEEALTAFYRLFPPDYLNKVIKDFFNDRTGNIDFKCLWKFYEHGWVDFDEVFFLRSLLVVQMFDRNTAVDADFLYDNPRALTQVFLKFYKHEMPVLDLSKWQAREGFVCRKVCEYWTEVLLLLQEKGYCFDRALIGNLLESLLNNWKKPHLDWHVRLLKLLKPTPEELLDNQAALLAILSTGQASLISYAVNHIKDISGSERFDAGRFIHDFPLVFLNEKNAKSILTGLPVLDELLSGPGTRDASYAEQIAVLFMQPDVKLQEQAALLLLKHFDRINMDDLIAPYEAYLKQQVKKMLAVPVLPEPEVVSEVVGAARSYQAVAIPTDWDGLLLQVGNCIRTQSALEMDLFYEGLNQLRDQVPPDFAKKLKPYFKQLFRQGNSYVMDGFSRFIASWIDGSPLPAEDGADNPVPFLMRKSRWLLHKIRNKTNLPFLSTPSHAPFYIHPDVFLDRLFLYEKQQAEVTPEDLVVACNRLLLREVDQKIMSKARRLKGTYAGVIHYYLGVSDEINCTEETLPLWTQVTRIKQPDGLFGVFKGTPAADYPAVINPLELSFEIEVDRNTYATWYRLILEGNWNGSWYRNTKKARQPSIYYNTASAGEASRTDIAYQLSLNPQYVDGQLCRYIPDTATGNEVREMEQCLFPLQFVVEHDIPIYHCGWIYIGVCLLFEKKVSRDLAADYISLAVQQGRNADALAGIIGRLLAAKFAPVNRLIEYLDKPQQNLNVKNLQWSILEQCILHFNPQDLPANHKKVIAYCKEWSDRLNREWSGALAEQVKRISK